MFDWEIGDIGELTGNKSAKQVGLINFFIFCLAPMEFLEQYVEKANEKHFVWLFYFVIAFSLKTKMFTYIHIIPFKSLGRSSIIARK